MRTFHDRPIVKEVINLGTAGVIERHEGMLDTPDQSIVTFQAKAKVNSLKYKFLENGKVEESTIMTIDPETFEIQMVEKAPEQLELPEGEANGQIPGAKDKVKQLAGAIGHEPAED